MSTSTHATTETIWQEVECGGYAADLPLYRELAAVAQGPILDLGAGLGRVALRLAADGHEVTALDNDPELLDALSRHAGEQGVVLRTVQADARDFSLDRADFALVLAPMQLFQLLGKEGRSQALSSCAAHLRAGGRMAIAIVDGSLPPASAAGSGPLPDVLERDGWVYSSLPVALSTRAGQIVVERLRESVSPEGALTERRVEVALDLLEADEVEAAARDAGLRPISRKQLPDTDEHVPSTVIVLEASHA